MVSYCSDEELDVDSKLQLINMVELASKIKGKYLNKAIAYANIYAHANPSTLIEKIDHDSSYPMLDRIVSRSIDVFKMNDALLNTLGARSEFKLFHQKR